MSKKCLCGLFGKTREGYDSVSREKIARREECRRKFKSAVMEIREQDPGIGAYKLYRMLSDIFPDEMMGRDAFYRFMHEHHLMLPPERRRHTTNSNHNYHKYKNLAKGMRPTRPNQLWVADITYIDTDNCFRLSHCYMLWVADITYIDTEEGVVYLHLLTDAFTHEIIGWTLSDSLRAENTVMSLEQAITLMAVFSLSGLTHHSDRGSQYCCNAYIEKLKSINAAISMTEDYKPTDNAIAERINGIIKQEWLYRMKRPRDLQHAREIISGIIDFYNTRRPHMSNEGMLPPRKLREKYLGI